MVDLIRRVGFAPSRSSNTFNLSQYCGPLTILFAAAWLALGLGTTVAAKAQVSCRVTSTSDSGAGDGGSGDLRYCLDYINSNGGGSVSFDSTVFSSATTIGLNAALPLITAGNVIINGPTTGKGGTLQNLVTVNGSNTYRILQVNIGATATIANLNFVNGRASSPGVGGAIYSAGALTVTNSTFSGNSAPSGGGAIVNYGTLVVTNSTFSGNAAPDGGAVMNNSTLTVTGSTFSGNSASDASGGGGAIMNNNSTLTVTSSTFSGNSAVSGGGAIFSNAGTLAVTGSTFSGNSATMGGGIRSAGASVTESYNVFYNDAGGDTSGFTPVTSDVTGGDPRLAPLGWYGGPTQSMILLPGSAAICAGSADAGITGDQRGFALDSSCPSGSVDAGAVQTNQYVVTTLDDSYKGSCTPAACSLRDALDANGVNAGDITFASSLFDSNAVSGTITLDAGLYSLLQQIAGQLNLLGPGAKLLTISAAGPVFTIESGAGAFFYGLTIRGGGAISNAGTVTVINSTLSGNSDSAITNWMTLTVSNSTFVQSSADNGAAIANLGAALVSNSTFSGNLAGAGGAILNYSGTLTVSNSTFSGNSASGVTGQQGAIYQGGAIYGNGGTLTVTDSTFSGNSAPSGGGAIYITGAGITESYNDFDSNNDVVGFTPSATDQAGSANLSALGWYGGLTQTMIPLSGSASLGNGVYLGGEPASDQRGAPRPSTTGAAIDIGAVQVSGNPPMISVSPNSGLTSGGTTVTVTGPDLDTATAVSFGGTAASSFSVAAASGSTPAYITAVSPAASAGMVNVTVTIGGSVTSTINPSDEFTYLTPIPTSLTPTVTPSETFPSNLQPAIPIISVELTASGAGIPALASEITATLDSAVSLTVTDSGSGNYAIALPATPLAVGSHSINVVFAGTTAAPFYAASSTPISLTVTAPINKPPNLVVNTASDNGSGALDCAYNPSGSGAGSCTLRDALAAAGYAGGGNITFDTTVFSPSNTEAQNTITLGSSGTMTIPPNTSITGPAAGSGPALTNLVTVRQVAVTGVFEISSNATVAAISNLNIANGFKYNESEDALGGGIYNSGTLSVANVTFTGNSVNAGSWGYTAGGGAIYNSGALTVTNSTFSGNSADGGIKNSENTAAWGAPSAGGAIYNDGGTLNVTNSTFSGNSANIGDGGGIYNLGSLRVTNSTFSGNSATSSGANGGYGGGIFSRGTLALSNTIVSGNVNGDVYDGTGTTTFTYAHGNMGGNVVGSYNSLAMNPAAVDLAPLGNYGGPTETMIPLPGSAAICAGSASAAANAGITGDQRGVALSLTASNASSYTGAGAYCAAGSVDAGAVQTDYALNFTAQQPSSVVAQATMTPAPIVTITESGSTFTAAAVSVGVTDAASDLTGTSTVSASTSGGQASFSNLAFTNVESSDTLTATVALSASANATATSSAFSVTQISQTITFNPAVTTYTYSSSGTFTLSATVSSSLAVSFASTTGSVCTVSGATVTILSVGTCTIQATQTGNTNYSAAAPVSVNFTIGQASQTITFTAPASPVTYGVAPISLSATGGSSGVAVVFSVISGPGTIRGSTLTVTSTGTIVVAANQWGNANYVAATQVTQSIAVNPATLIVAANNATKVYGTANPTFTGTVTGAVNGDSFVESFATAATTSSDVGAYPIVPNVTGSNLSNYTETVANGTLAITPAATTTTVGVSSASITPGQSVTLTANVASATTGSPSGTVSFYDGTTLLDTATMVSGTASYSTTAWAPGFTHAITATYSGNADFSGSSATSTATVTVAPLDFTMTLALPANLTVVPGESVSFPLAVTPAYGVYAGTMTFALAGLPFGATASFSPSSISPNSGPQTVTVTIQTAAAAAALQRHSSPSSDGRMTRFALAFLLLFGVGRIRARGRGLRRLLCVVVLVAGGAAAVVLSGCGAKAAAPQNYPVTLTATAGNVQHSVTFILKSD